MQCVKGGGNGVLGYRQINICRKKSLYRSIFLDDDILHCLLWVLTFYVVTPTPKRMPPKWKTKSKV
jgi:hypothetical protein